jgi:hypothetical protein
MFPLELTGLASPSPGRRQPVKAESREAGARNAPALTGWRWSGLLGFKPVSPLFRSQPQPSLSAQAPFDATVIAHEAGDVLPDAVVEQWLPRYEAEAETAIAAQGFEHGEPAAGQLGRSDELAAYGVARSSGSP